MFRLRILPRAMLCLALGCAAHSAAQQYESVWYSPHVLPAVQDASDRLQFLVPHLAPVTIEDGKFYLQSGYTLARADVNKFGIQLVFRRTSDVPAGQYHWNWGSGYTTSTYTPERDDLVTRIVFGDIGYFQIWDMSSDKGGTPWCVVPIHRQANHNEVLCVRSIHDAHVLVDSLATLVQAGGGRMIPPFGLWATSSQDEGEKRRRGVAGCRISEVDWNGPPAKAGVRIGDILYTINGTPCTERERFLDVYRQAAGSALDGGSVQVELFRKGKRVALELHYPNAASDANLLAPENAAPTTSGESSVAPSTPMPETQAQPAVAQAPAAAPAAAPAVLPLPASAPGSIRLGVQVRAVTEPDVSAFKLSVPRGILVVSVDRGGLADAMQMQAGDIILAVNDIEIANLQTLAQFLRSGAAKTFRVWHKGQSVVLIIPQSL